MSTEVLRSTKRFVNRSWSASDSLSSISRVFSCQCAGSASQPGRCDTKVQVRIWAMRADSVSMSPSVPACRPVPPCRLHRHGLAGEIEIDADDVGMLGWRDAAVVRQAQASQSSTRRRCGNRRTLILRQMLQRPGITAGSARQPSTGGTSIERQPREEIESGRAPLQHLHRLEIVRLDALTRSSGTDRPCP